MGAFTVIKGEAETRKAKSLWFTEPHKIQLREEIVQRKPQEKYVESKIMGISHGTEMLLFKGDIPEEMKADTTIPSLEGALSYPIKYGYINVGYSEDGERVFAFFPHQDVFAIREEDMIVLPEDLSFSDAVFLAHLETALSIVQDAHPIPGEVLLVLGLGTVGLLVTEVLGLCQWIKVITVDPLERRREISSDLGSLALSSDDPALRDKIDRVTGSRGVDCAINVSGCEKALQLAIDTTAFEGTIIEASWYGSRPSSIHLGSAFHRKRLRIKSSQVSSIRSSLSGRWNKARRIRFVLDLLKQIKPGKYITHRYKLDQAQEAFELIAHHPEETLQVVLEP